jgi:membrane associated rhomboid family serine protease
VRVVCGLVGWSLIAIGAAFVALTFGEGGDARDGGLIIAAGCALVGGPFLFAWTRLRRRGTAAPTNRSPEAAWPDAPPPAHRAPVHDDPQTLELRPSRKRWGALFVLGLVFVAGGVFIILDGASGGWFVLLFFGACTLAFGVQLVPGAAWLRLTPEGFEWRAMGRRSRFRWDDVERFHVYTVTTRYRTQEHVGFDFSNRTPEHQTLWQTIARGVSGGADHALPDTYGRDAEDLAQTMQRWRDRYATRRGPSPSQLADAELARAAAAVDRSSVPAVTTLLALACLVAFGIVVARDGPFPSAQTLVDLGGATADAFGDGRVWTLLTANVLHADPVHLLLNLVGLGLLGVALEREIGWPRMLVVAVAGGLASMLLAIALSGGAVTVGVSGVIFAVAAYGVRRDLHMTRALGAVAWSFLPVSVIYTFLSPGTSIGGHIGGLLAGLVLHALLEGRAGRTLRARSALTG